MAHGRCSVEDFTSNELGESRIGYIPDTINALYQVFGFLVEKNLFDTNPVNKKAIGPNVVLVFSGNAALSDKVVSSVWCTCSTIWLSGLLDPRCTTFECCQGRRDQIKPCKSFLRA